ncbi:MAG: lytic transglycosylase domain-containing protein [Gaiellaceae bacterium]
MRKETHRRLAALAIVGAVAGGSTAALKTASVTAMASAAATPPARTKATRTKAMTRTKPCPFPHELRGAFERASADAQIPPAMLYAVAKVESNLYPDAESEAGARGLLQLMPATAESLALNVDEPRSNVLGGARYLRQLLDRFSSTDLALAAYNAGPTAVQKAGAAPSASVQTYVANVNEIWQSVAGCS